MAPGASAAHGVGRRHASGTVHLAVSVGAGLVVAVALGGSGTVTAVLAGWVAASGAFLLWTWIAVWPLDGPAAARVARREDPGRALNDVVLLVAGTSAVVVVVAVVFHAQQVGPVRTMLALVCIATAWGVLQTVHLVRYTRMYYALPSGGVDFHQDDDPTYRDFAYLAMTVGTTFQVSDTDITDARLRSVVMRHGLLSFVYNTVVIAVVVNLVASLGR